HVLEGLRVALDHIDAVIALIRASRTVDEARAGLMREFGLSERQAQAILDMRLQRLTGLEREKVLEELASVLQEIQRLRAILASEDLLLNVIREELMKVRERFADARRTRIIAGEADFDEEDLIAEEDVVVTLTHRGYIKRLPLDTYRSQHRGGRGVTGLSTRDDDFVEHLFVAGTHHWVLFFTNRGRMYRLKVHEVPEAGRTARGVVLANCIPLEEGEQVTAVVPVQEFQEAVCLCMATRRGIVKKTDLAEFVNARRTGIIAISLDEGDELIAVRLVPAGADVVLVTRAGMAIRFSGDEVRAMGRTARGVAGIALEPGDQVVAMELAEDGADLLVVTQMGYGKRTPYAAYRRQSRGGKGLKTIRSTDRNGPIVGALTVRSGDEVMCISSQGLLIRQPVADIPVLGRDTLGVRVMRLEEGETLVAVAPVVAQGEDV
ncbi:MAG: DNA gyrase subunit A, partial [Clostridia bacterium]|nr:DNA gyrase subunit A [Clostridia bacterium]